MVDWFNDLISEGSVKSSARFLNIFGAFVLAGVFIADFAVNKKINIEAFYALAAYFGGVYGVSKTLNVYDTYRTRKRKEAKVKVDVKKEEEEIPAEG